MDKWAGQNQGQGQNEYEDDRQGKNAVGVSGAAQRGEDHFHIITGGERRARRPPACI
jgi:hypothetical protein